MKQNNKEAIYGFVAWLTSRQEKTVLSAKDDAAPAVQLAEHYAKSQGLDEIRDEFWPSVLVPMKGDDLVLRRPISEVTEEDALECVKLYLKSVNYSAIDSESAKIIGITGMFIKFSYKATKPEHQTFRRLDELGFAAFNYLQSLGYILK